MGEVTRRKVIETFGGCLPGLLRSTGARKSPVATPEQRLGPMSAIFGPIARACSRFTTG